MKYPRIAEKMFIKINTVIDFIKLKFTKPRFNSIEIFVIAEISDIKKYPTIRAYVPKYFGKKIMQSINMADEMA